MSESRADPNEDEDTADAAIKPSFEGSARPGNYKQPKIVCAEHKHLAI
jgi:hypothetical protein